MTKVNTLTIGIDLSDEYSHMCVLDADAEVIEESRIRTTEAA
jgi:transposase